MVFDAKYFKKKLQNLYLSLSIYILNKLQKNNLFLEVPHYHPEHLLRNLVDKHEITPKHNRFDA